MVSFGSTTYSKRLLHLVSWSHWFTFFNIIAAVLLSTTYLFSETLPETFLGKLYLITTWLSHMSFLTFIGFVLLIFPLTLIYPKTRFIRGSASVIFTLGLLLLLLDAFIYSRLGYHLNASSSGQIISLIQSQISSNPRAFWFISIMLFMTILLFQLVVSNYAWKHLRELQKTVFARFIVIGLVFSFFFSHLVHIWADANLEYDILRQDTVLPLSYPSTAKTLLTKYGMFDKQDYIARKTSPLSFNETISNYPVYSQQCEDIEVKRSAILVLTDQQLTQQQIDQFKQRSSTNSLILNSHIDNAVISDSWFNLLFSLPSLYKENAQLKQSTPLIISIINAHNIPSHLTIISPEEASTNKVGIQEYFTHSRTVKDISQEILSVDNQSKVASLNVIYFSQSSNYQFELFIDALLLAQREKQVKDFIWISSIGNLTSLSSLSIKPALLIDKNVNNGMTTLLTSQMDIAPTLMNSWLGCKVDSSTYSVGTNIVSLNNDRVIANTTEQGLMVFNKDKSVLIDQNGNFQSYSRQLESPIMVSSDFPLMIDGVNFIMQFAKHNKSEQ